MIVGIGIDIVESIRIRDLIEKHPQKFIDRILSDEEIKQFDIIDNSRKTNFVAGRFAAKEAFAKALGNGIGELAFTDITIISGGQPQLIQNKKIKNILEANFGKAAYNILVTISHEKQNAIAMVIIDKLNQ